MGEVVDDADDEVEDEEAEAKVGGNEDGGDAEEEEPTEAPKLLVVEEGCSDGALNMALEDVEGPKGSVGDDDEDGEDEDADGNNTGLWLASLSSEAEEIFGEAGGANEDAIVLTHTTESARSKADDDDEEEEDVGSLQPSRRTEPEEVFWGSDE